MHAQAKHDNLERITRGFALAGGVLLSLMAVLVVSSIAGRIVFGRPIPGDFEIVAMITAISIFLCLPYCHLRRGNVVVNLFLSADGRPLTRWLDALAAAVYGVIALLFTWRMTMGMVDAIQFQDISVIVGLPLWWAYPPAIASFALLALCCAATAKSDLKAGPT